MKNRIVSLMLAAMMFIAALSSCGERTPADTARASDDTAAPESTEVLDERLAADDELGSYDFDAYTFRIVTSDNHTKHYFVEESDGDVVNDALFKRNQTVEERFNCEIRVISDTGFRETAIFTNSIAAAEDAVDLICWQAIGLGGYVTGDLFMNWYDIPGVNFEKPWWSDSNIEHLTFGDYCPIAIGDLMLSALGGTYCVYYNKTRGLDYGIPDMYEVVNDGKWTFDYLIAAAKDICKDLNGNSSADEGDYFGFASDTYSNINAYMWAFDNPIYTKDKEELVFSLNVEKSAAIAEKLVNAFTVNPGFSVGPMDVFNYGIDLFARRQALFANGCIGHSLSKLRDLEDDYAILPYPKWDENQEDYYTMVDGSHQVMAVPVTVSDPEKIGVIVEALCAESYKQVVPAYYDVALKLKGARDDESIEMLDRIVASRVFDFGYIYDNWQGASFILQELVWSRSADFASLWASRESAIRAHYDSVIDYFADRE